MLFTIVLAACASSSYRAPVREVNYYSINADGTKSETYSRMNEWSTYGTRGLGAQATMAAAYEKAQHAPPPGNQIEIYNASLPPGVTIEHGVVKITGGAPYEAIGRFSIGYWQASAPHEAEIEPDLHRLASVAGGDAIVVEVQRRDRADDRVQYLLGLVLRKRTADAAAGPAEPAAVSTHTP